MKTNRNNRKTEKTMKQLILKGLGKAKVKRIIKSFIIDEFNTHLEYNHDVAFTLPTYVTVMGFGLPEMDEDNPFELEDLLIFIGKKI